MRKFCQLIETFNWTLFLLLVFSVSFIQKIFPSDEWEFCSLIVFTILILECLLRLCNVRVGLSHSKTQLIFLGLISAGLLLLVVQVFLPSSGSIWTVLNPAYTGSSMVGPESFRDSFNFDEYLSVSSANTLNLLRTEVLVFSGFLACLLLVTNRRRLMQLVWVFYLLAMIHVLIGLGAKLAGIHLIDIADLDGNYSGVRGIFVNRNHYAAFLVLLCFSPLVYLIRKHFEPARESTFRYVLNSLLSPYLFVVASLILLLIGIVASESRAAIASFVTATAICFTLIAGEQKRSQGFLLIVIVSVISSVYWFGDTLVTRFNSPGPLLGERWLQWQVTWSAIAERPLLGYGGNSYADVFQAFRGEAELRELIYNQAHNDYLHIWLEQGLVGLVIWLGICGLVLYHAIQSAKRSKSSLVYAVQFAAATVILAALIQSFVDFNLHIISIRFLFFVILGMVFASESIYREQLLKKN